MKRLTSLRFDVELWKKVKIHCINKDLTIEEFLSQLIKKEINLVP